MKRQHDPQVCTQEQDKPILDQTAEMTWRMSLPHTASVLTHYAVGSIKMVVVCGKASLSLNGQGEQQLDAGNSINIAARARMDLANRQDDVLQVDFIKVHSQI